MNESSLRILLKSYERRETTDVIARMLFLECQTLEIDTPDWLMEQITLVIKKIQDNYELNHKSGAQLGVEVLVEEAQDVHFMWEIDDFRKQGLTVDQAVAKIDSDRSDSALRRDYYRIKKIFGDFPPEPLF